MKKVSSISNRYLIKQSKNSQVILMEIILIINPQTLIMHDFWFGH